MHRLLEKEFSELPGGVRDALRKRLDSVLRSVKSDTCDPLELKLAIKVILDTAKQLEKDLK